MAWKSDGLELSMTEGDYGVSLDIGIPGLPYTEGDSVRMTFKSFMNGTEILEKDLSFVEAGKFSLTFTAQDSAKFRVGQYFYSIDWYKGGVFMCNIVPSALFRVVDKA